jgi:hypothetical protein
MAVIPPRPTPPRLPHLGVVGKPAEPAGCQLFNPSPCPHTSLDPPTWASVARGDVYTRVEEATCTGPPPAITAAEFSWLFERCMASGLKARLVTNHMAGCQTITVTCTLPVTAENATAAGRRRRRRHHHRWRGRAATATVCSSGANTAISSYCCSGRTSAILYTTASLFT